MSGTISRRVAGRRLSDSPLLQTSGNSYFLSGVMDTPPTLQKTCSRHFRRLCILSASLVRLDENVLMVSLAIVSDLDVIAIFNVEAYREFAVRMSPTAGVIWR